MYEIKRRDDYGNIIKDDNGFDTTLVYASMPGLTESDKDQIIEILENKFDKAWSDRTGFAILSGVMFILWIGSIWRCV